MRSPSNAPDVGDAERVNGRVRADGVLWRGIRVSIQNRHHVGHGYLRQ